MFVLCRYIATQFILKYHLCSLNGFRQLLCHRASTEKKHLTVKVSGDGTCLAFVVSWPLAGETVLVATHAGELVVV